MNNTIKDSLDKCFPEYLNENFVIKYCSMSDDDITLQSIRETFTNKILTSLPEIRRFKNNAYHTTKGTKSMIRLDTMNYMRIGHVITLAKELQDKFSTVLLEITVHVNNNGTTQVAIPVNEYDPYKHDKVNAIIIRI